MSIEFFEAQRRYKRLSLLIYGLFMMTVCFHALVLLLLCWVITLFFVGDFDISYWLMSLMILAFYIGFGIFFGKQQANLGGIGVAKKLGAVRLFVDKTDDKPDNVYPLDNQIDNSQPNNNQSNDNSSNSQAVIFYPTFIKAKNVRDLPSGYARFYEFAEQMSLASGVPLPKLYVLVDEMSINALVAGFDRADTVLILTQGAVDKLDNEALYGLIGHEFGQILHQDARLNLKISTLMAGLSWLYEGADGLENWLFGKSYADYRHTHTSQSLNFQTPCTREQWVGYWQQRQQYKLGQARDVVAGVIALSLQIRTGLWFVRLFGVLGMISHDWIISQFNRQRVFLSDATSMQLTRSFGIAKALLARQIDGQTTKQPQGHKGYFFFADVGMSDGFFDAHPSIEKRLDVLNAHTYEAWGKQAVAHLNAQTLDFAHQKASNHKPITPLSQEMQDWQTAVATSTLAFEMVADKVVNGRLVVDKQWYDWSDDKPNANHTKPSVLYPNKDPQTPSKAQATAKIQATLPRSWQEVRDEFDHLTHQSNDNQTTDKQTDDKPILDNLPWEIVKYQRQVVGVLSVIESIVLCRHAMIDTEQSFDLFDIYLQSSYVQRQDFQTLSDTTPKRILSHRIDTPLLQRVVELPRLYDGQLLVRCFRALFNHLNNPNKPINDTQKSTLTHYHQGIVALIEQYHYNPNAKPITDFGRLTAKMDKLWQAGVLATLMTILSKVQSFDVYYHKHSQQVLAFVMGGGSHFQKISDDTDNAQQNQAWLLVLLAFLATVQDNSLLIQRYEPMVGAFHRWCMLMDLPILDKEQVIALFGRSHCLQSGDWACGLWVLAYRLNARQKTNLVHTLHTALLYDGKMVQKEADILAILDYLFDDKR